jgi:hypothetical protein
MSGRASTRSRSTRATRARRFRACSRSHRPGYLRIKRAFRQLVDNPGLGVITSEAGIGKTAAFRNLCAELPRPDHLVLYLCDTSVSPLDLYRTLADELGVRRLRLQRARRGGGVSASLVKPLELLGRLVDEWTNRDEHRHPKKLHACWLERSRVMPASLSDRARCDPVRKCSSWALQLATAAKVRFAPCTSRTFA